MLSTNQFSTKAYTIERLISEVTYLSNPQVTSVANLAAAVSPRAGVNGAKLAFLNSYVGGNLEAVIVGRGSFASFGRTPRTRILRALRARKQQSSN